MTLALTSDAIGENLQAKSRLQPKDGAPPALRFRSAQPRERGLLTGALEALVVVRGLVAERVTAGTP